MGEAKRNPNDIGRGFARRQVDLAWLTGDAAGYDPAAMRTRTFPTGHFDRPATHVQDGEQFLIGPESFRTPRRFRRDPASGAFLDRLFFVTRPGTLWGLSSVALHRVAARVASDDRWHVRDAGYLRELCDWCRSLAGPVESPDVLRLYAGRRGGIVVHPGQSNTTGDPPP